MREVNKRALDARLRKNEEEARAAFIRWENAARREKGARPVGAEDAVYFPGGPKASMLFLNWKVWSERYRVGMDFVVASVLERYERARRCHERSVGLGLPAALAAGPSARGAVEEAVRRAFPSGENVRAARQRPSPPPPRLPGGLGAEDLVCAYSTVMERRQREFRAAPAPERRNYRKA